MRLFVAIDLPDEAKHELWLTALRLEHQALRARVVPRENYHLTLLFIGETTRIDDARAALHSLRLSHDPIDLVFNGIGSFKQHNGFTWWVGIEPSPALASLAAELTRTYRAAGFTFDTRSFKPHITLARKVTTTRPIALEAPSYAMKADRLSLMRSTNKDGSMVYTEIDCLEL